MLRARRWLLAALPAAAFVATACGTVTSYRANYERICHSTAAALLPVEARLVGHTLTPAEAKRDLSSPAAPEPPPGVAAHEIAGGLEQKVRIGHRALQQLAATQGSSTAPRPFHELLAANEQKLADETRSARGWLSGAQPLEDHPTSAAIALDASEAQLGRERQFARELALKCVLP